VVEDSPGTRDLLARSLTGAGFRVQFASRVSSGLRRIQNESFDAIVLDIMLPDGDGIALCRAMRAEGVTTPVLFLSARDDISDRVASLDAGGDDFLRKPFALAELNARLRALARRRGMAPSARLEAADAAIDFAGRRLTRGGSEVPLTSREWEVLELLAGRAGRVVSRAEVLEVLWGHVSDENSASLDVIVSRLRRKLGDGSGPWLITTIRGEGFRFGLRS